MGRAPNPGGPQRVTAHVVPRAKPYPDGAEDEEDDDEASTAIAWGEEASTTIEHGQIAKKPAPLPPTRPGNVNPNSGNIVTGNNGNVTQTGAHLDDHTVDDQNLARDVLSAITPIRPDANARLSITQGNDVGQAIEIRPGKTYTIGRGIDNDVVLTDISVSRKHFDLKHEDGAWVIVDRGSGNGTVVNGNLEDNPFMLATGDTIEIGNTVFRFEQANGEPRSAPTYDIEDEELSTVAGKPVREESEQLPAIPQRTLRPKTIPPPVPLRPTSRSTPPPLSAYLAAQQQGLPPHMSPPTPASTMPMAQMANRAPMNPGPPTMLGDAMGMPMHGQPQNLAQTIGGQGPSVRPSFPYPQAMEIPPHSVHAQMLIQQTQGRRGDISTAHVQPVPYMQMPMAAPSGGYEVAQISRRTKLVLAGVGLAILTGIVTAAVMKSGDKPKASASATATVKPGAKADAKGDAKTTPAAVKQQPTVEPIVPSGPKQEPTKIAAITPLKQEPTKQEPAKQGTVAPPKQVVAPPKQEPPKQVAVVPPKQVVAPRVVKQEPKRESREKKRETRREPVREAPKKRVAAAVDVEGAEEKADGLYRARNFNGAAKVLADAARNADDDDAKDLRLKSDKYAQLGKVYSQGTAPAAKPNVAFQFLRQASNYDRNLGNAFDSDIQTRLAAVAPKAAISYLAQQKYTDARSAMIVAKQLGSTDSNLQLVRQKLDAVAGELYNEAAKEMSSNPSAAKEKLRQVKSYVEPKSTWAVKADALLRKG